jgi:hypothetical protein
MPHSNLSGSIQVTSILIPITVDFIHSTRHHYKEQIGRYAVGVIKGAKPVQERQVDLCK